jgi:hypothetical protein
MACVDFHLGSLFPFHSPLTYISFFKTLSIIYLFCYFRKMSGLEVAAGAFAAVGVADVLVRTGREVYSFLRDVADAPKELERLRETVHEIVLLADTSRPSLETLKAGTAGGPPTAATSSLETAMKALNRELRSLKGVIPKFKGRRTWTNVKFVLDTSKVAKSLRNLESAKMSFASALTLACRYAIFSSSVFLAC